MSRFVMFLLASYPILSYYKGLVGFTHAETFTIVLFFFACVREKTIAIKLPRLYKHFWLYTAIALIVTSYISGGFSVTYLVPGGISFFIWSIALGLSIRYFDFILLKRYLYILFVIASILLIGQEISYVASGSRFVPFLPLSNELAVYDMSYSDLITLRATGPRSCSIFAEPSYFALYALPVLVIELFSTQNQGKPYTFFSLFVIFILLLLKSGVALLGLAVVVFIKFFTFFKHARRKVVLYTFLCIPIICILVSKYISSEVGADMLARTEEFSSNNSSAYFRIIRGYIIYFQLPTINQLFGMSTDLLLKLNISDLIFSLDDSSNLYFNGVQTLLIKMGLVGLFVCLRFYVDLYKNANPISICLLWILLFYSLVDQIFLSPSMLLCTSISCSLYSGKK